MRVLGIDPSIRATGWAWIECDKKRKRKILDCGVVKIEGSPKWENITQRLCELGSKLWIDCVLDWLPKVENKYCFIEIPRAGNYGERRGASIFKQGMAWAICFKFACEEVGLNQVYTVTPYEWKRNMPKEQTRLWVVDKFGKQIKDHNVIDAIGIADYGTTKLIWEGKG